VLGLSLERLRVVANDSVVTPKDNGSYSSRVSFMVGNAAIRAAQALRDVLVAAARASWRSGAAEVECLGELYRAAGTDRTIGYKDVVTAALVDAGTLTVKGVWSTPVEVQGGKFKGAAVGTGAGYSYAAQVVEVDVDDATGVVKVERVWWRTTAAARSTRWRWKGRCRVRCGWAWARRCAEETRYQDGLPLTANFIDYRMPTIVESPPIDVFIVEAPDPHGPFGARRPARGRCPVHSRP